MDPAVARPRIIVVVPGVGRKTPGWTDRLNLLANWGPAEALLRLDFNEGASGLAPYCNFTYRSDAWIASLAGHIQHVATSYPGSNIDVVGHSSGSVIAATLLSGGSVFGKQYDPIAPALLGSSSCRHLVTMGNPLCRTKLSRIAGIHLDRSRPSILTGRWVNMHNRLDRLPYLRIAVGDRPLDMEGCEDVELSPTIRHTGYWRSKEVAECIRSLA